MIRVLVTIFLGVLAFNAVFVTFMGLCAVMRERRQRANDLKILNSEWDGEDWMHRDITDEEFEATMEDLMERD